MTNHTALMLSLMNVDANLMMSAMVHTSTQNLFNILCRRNKSLVLKMECENQRTA